MAVSDITTTEISSKCLTSQRRIVGSSFSAGSVTCRKLDESRRGGDPAYISATGH
jgi:hypothetical protein